MARSAGSFYLSKPRSNSASRLPTIHPESPRPTAALPLAIMSRTDGRYLWYQLVLYEIQSPLGASGMGEVYRAKDTRLDRSVAIKILPAQFSADPVRKQ